MDPRLVTYAATLANSREFNCQAPGISGGSPLPMSSRRAVSLAAWSNLARWRLGPRPPVPVCPWQTAHWDSKRRWPRTGSPTGSGSGGCAKARGMRREQKIQRTVIDIVLVREAGGNGVLPAPSWPRLGYVFVALG